MLTSATAASVRQGEHEASGGHEKARSDAAGFKSLSRRRDASGGPEHARWIHLHPRTHGRGDRDPLDIGALGAGGLRLLHRVGEGADVLDELALVERRLADAGMDDAGLL